MNENSLSYSGSGGLDTFRRYGSTPRRRKSMIMSDEDKIIYNSLGSTSSPLGKLTFTELGLHRGWRKRGVMCKTGPNPTWLTPWKRRCFILKGNFIYYFSCQRKMSSAPVLGAIYLKNAIIKKENMGFCKTVLKISPPVPRRKGCSEENSDFFIKFMSTDGRDEWYEELQQVSFENDFPMERAPLINTSMEYTSSYTHNSPH